MINVGEDIDLVDFQIFGDLDLSKISPSGDITRGNISSNIHIINSVMHGSIYF